MELPACPVETTLMLIGDKWKVLILRDLMGGTKRFGELKKSIGHVTQKVLTAQLRDMEEKKLLTRKVYAEVPPRVEYTLTETGYSLKPILDSMVVWGSAYQEETARRRMLVRRIDQRLCTAGGLSYKRVCKSGLDGGMQHGRFFDWRNAANAEGPAGEIPAQMGADLPGGGEK